MNCRKRTGFALAAFVVLAGSVASVSAQQAPAAAPAAPPPAPVTSQLLSGDVYLLSGGVGSNTGAIVGKDGVIIVDTKTTADSGQQILATVAKITPKPVTTAIVTHSDGDHVNGLAAFPKGLTIISQTNCKTEMEKSQGSAMPAPADHMPTKLIDTDEKVTINGVRLELLHWAPAHTSGDLVVFLPDQKIVFTGDIIASNRPLTLIHTEKNGSAEGWIKSVKGIVALNADTFVPGHGDVQNKAQLQARLDSVVERRDQILALIKQGKTLDEIKQQFNEPLAAQRFPTFTEAVYQEATAKK
jgi:glyoxylase-like metal-dependent hydrolase (beta-lactamase superfamily II)